MKGVLAPLIIEPPPDAVHWMEIRGPLDEPANEMEMESLPQGISNKWAARVMVGATVSMGTVTVPTVLQPPNGSVTVTEKVPLVVITGDESVDEKPPAPLHKKVVLGRLALADRIPLGCWQVKVSVVTVTMGADPSMEIWTLSTLAQPFISVTTTV